MIRVRVRVGLGFRFENFVLMKESSFRKEFHSYLRNVFRPWFVSFRSQYASRYRVTEVIIVTFFIVTVVLVTVTSHCTTGARRHTVA